MVYLGLGEINGEFILINSRNIFDFLRRLRVENKIVWNLSLSDQCECANYYASLGAESRERQKNNNKVWSTD